jgi:prepilin peptidase CpaA
MSDAASAIVLLQPGFVAIAVVLLGIATLNDLAARTIPDRVSLGLAAIGVAARLADGNAAAAFVASAVVFVLAALCWRFGWLGGGDVKLLAACAWLAPPPLVPQLVLLTAIIGGILACLYLALGWLIAQHTAPVPTGRPRALAARVWRVERWRIRRRASLPYGCAISVAALFTLLNR